MSRSYTSSPPQAPPWRVEGLLYFYCTYLFIKVRQLFFMSHLLTEKHPLKNNGKSSNFQKHIFTEKSKKAVYKNETHYLSSLNHRL
jgi:hypothetical protein